MSNTKREIIIRSSCLAADLRAFLDDFDMWSEKELIKWRKDLDDSLRKLEKFLSENENEQNA